MSDTNEPSDPSPRESGDADVDAMLAAMPVQFWMCPRGHSDTFGQPPRETVRWVDNVAHCLETGCDKTSANSLTNAPTLRAGLLDVLEMFGDDDIPAAGLRRLLALPDASPADDAATRADDLREGLSAARRLWSRKVAAFEEVAARPGQEDAAEYWAMAATLSAACGDASDLLTRGKLSAERWGPAAVTDAQPTADLAQGPIPEAGDR